ncbi:MAG: hypothetical protein ACI4R9_02080 [Kiritimatiellia bacterium]
MGSCLLFFGLSLLTVRLWGGDVSHDHLIMLIDGKMLGQMHLGEYDILDYESCWPRDFADKAHADSERAGAAVEAVVAAIDAAPHARSIRRRWSSFAGWDDGRG